MKAWHVVLIVMACITMACNGNRHGSHIIVQNAVYTLTGDSLIENDIIATASTDYFIESTLTRERLDSIVAAFASSMGHDRAMPIMVGGKPWQSNHAEQQYMQYKSPQKLINALHNMSMDHIAAASTGNTFDAHADTMALYCAIYLSLAHIAPQRSMATLQQLVTNGEIARSDRWPASAMRLAWGVAAWEVYTATADKQWLAFVHNVLDQSLFTDCKLLQDHDTHLLHGYNGGRPNDYYPAWMGPTDIVQTMPLITNVLTMRAMEILYEIDEELNLTHQHTYDVARQKSAINQWLWSERGGGYSAYLYGNMYQLRAPISDNLAQALAVLWGIADDDRAATLIKKAPLTMQGVPMLFPWKSIVEPYFSATMWPAVQALWTIAAASVSNDDMVRAGMAALYRAQALFQSRHITVQGESRNDLLCAAANQAILLRVIAGINFTADGIEMNPYVPACLTGDKVIKGFRLGKATLNITISGTGNSVKSISLDGEPIEGNFIAASLTGNHTVDVKLVTGKVNHGITVAKTQIALPPPPDMVWTTDSGYITDYVTSGRYMMLVNGKFNLSLGDIAFGIPSTKQTIEVSVVRANKYGFGFMARPHMMVRSELYEQAINFSDSLDINVNVKHAGNHLLQVDYTTSGQCDAMLVNINSHPQGTLLMPSGNDTLHSNIVNVKLLRGNNRIVLHRHPAVKASASPFTLRLIKQ